MKKICSYGLQLLLCFALVIPLFSCSKAPAVVQTQAPAVVQTQAPAVVPTESQGNKLHFVFVSHYGPESEWEARVISGWNAAIETLSAEVVGETRFGEGDYTKTMDLVKTAVEEGDVDGLLILSYDLEGTTPLLQEGLDKGISIVTAAMKAKNFAPEQIPSTGLDYNAQGYIAGAYNAVKYKEAGLVKDVNIGFFAEMISEYSVERRAGFLRALDDAGITYKAQDTLETGMDLPKNLDMIKSYLITHDELNAIVCLGSVSTPAAATALKELGYEPGKVLWTGFDLSPAGAEGIRAGFGAINVDEAFNHGFYGAMILYEKVKFGLKIGNLPIFSIMVDPSNIDQYK